MVRLANDLGINEEDVYPADYFDLIGGVGFGGYVFPRYGGRFSSSLQTSRHFARPPLDERG